ncbi:MAG: DUF3465 domain-containing protein [Candidatus Eremiobacteraeota bacterium]|nr:DUF3465 domain-containing protein [Candidatus Eremiobacteraeota bacterium]
MDLAAAYAGTAPAWVDFTAIVSSAPRFFYSSRSHAMHEAFNAESSAGKLEVVDNVSIAPRCPVQTGDSVEVRGELVHDPGRLPVVHWTHHDPAHHHADGFIRLHGALYA